MTRKTRLALLVLGLASSTTYAGPDTGADYVSSDAAFTRSLVGSAIPIAAIGLGIGAERMAGQHDLGLGLIVTGGLVGLVTPAMGEFYAHRYLTTGLAMRLGGVGLGGVAAVSFIAAVSSDHERGGLSTDALFTVLALGGALYLGGIVADVAGARDAARSYDHDHGYTVAPILIRAPGTQTAGLGFATTF